MAVTVSLERLQARSICSIIPLSMESNSLEKSTKKNFASRFFALTPSVIGWIVRICDEAFLTLTVIEVKVMPL